MELYSIGFSISVPPPTTAFFSHVPLITWTSSLLSCIPFSFVIPGAKWDCFYFSKKSSLLLSVSFSSFFRFYTLVFLGSTLFWSFSLLAIGVFFFSWSVVLPSVFFISLPANILWHIAAYKLFSAGIGFSLIVISDCFSTNPLSPSKNKPHQTSLRHSGSVHFPSEKWYNGVYIFVDNRKRSCFVLVWNETWCLSIVSSEIFFLSSLYQLFINLDKVSTFGKYTPALSTLNVLSNQSKKESLLFLLKWSHQQHSPWSPCCDSILKCFSLLVWHLLG